MIVTIAKIEDKVASNGNPYKSIIDTNGGVNVIFPDKATNKFPALSIGQKIEVRDKPQSTEQAKANSIETQSYVENIINLWIAGIDIPMAFKAKVLSIMAKRLDVKKPDGAEPTVDDIEKYLLGETK